MASRLAKVQAETQPTPAENGPPIRVIIADSQAIFRVGIRKVLAMEEDLRVVAQAETLADNATLKAALDTYQAEAQTGGSAEVEKIEPRLQDFSLGWTLSVR